MYRTDARTHLQNLGDLLLALGQRLRVLLLARTEHKRVVVDVAKDRFSD
jgi:hypothetical protein